MTDRDRRALTDLATGNLPPWRTLWLRKRLARDPELASEWEKTQDLFQKLRQESLPDSVPEPPKWPAPQPAPKERFAMLKKPVVLVAAGFAAFFGVTFVSVYQTKRADEAKEIREKFARRQDEREIQEFYLAEKTRFYDPETTADPIELNPNRKIRQIEEYDLVADTHTNLRITWKVFGKVRVVATYADGHIVSLDSRTLSDSRLVEQSKRYRSNFPWHGPPIVQWSRGELMDGRLYSMERADAPRRIRDESGDQVGFAAKFGWAKRVDFGRFEGFGTHQIKGKDGKVLVTLLVEPLSVQSKHDSESSQRRAKDPVRP